MENWRWSLKQKRGPNPNLKLYPLYTNVTGSSGWMDKMTFIQALADVSWPTCSRAHRELQPFLGLRGVDTSYRSRDEAP